MVDGRHPGWPARLGPLLVHAVEQVHGSDH